MPAWASTLLGVALGAGLTYLVSIRIESSRRREIESRERRAALATYLARLTIVVSFVQQWPEELPPSALERVREATFERSARVRSSDWIRTQKEMRKVLGDEPYRPLYRLIEAYTELRFVGLRESVWREVVASMNYVERLAKDRSEAALDAWPEIRKALFGAIRAAGDEIAIESAVETAGLTEAVPSVGRDGRVDA
jgi:hypothetical protein